MKELFKNLGKFFLTVGKINNSFIVYGERNHNKLIFSIFLSFIFLINLNKLDSIDHFQLYNYVSSGKFPFKTDHIYPYLRIITCGINYLYSKHILDQYRPILIQNRPYFSTNHITLEQISTLKQRYLNRCYLKEPIIYIIYCVNNCTEYVINSLLKVTEEYDKYIYIIYVGFGLAFIPDTLISRCFRLNVDYFDGLRKLNFNSLFFLNFIEFKLFSYIISKDGKKFWRFLNCRLYDRFTMIRSFIRILQIIYLNRRLLNKCIIISSRLIETKINYYMDFYSTVLQTGNISLHLVYFFYVDLVFFLYG